MLLPVHFSPCGNKLFYLLQFERVVQLKKIKPLGRARKRYLFIIYNFVSDKTDGLTQIKTKTSHSPEGVLHH